MLPERDLVRESDDRSGLSFSTSDPRLRHPREGEEDHRTSHQADHRKARHGEQEAGAQARVHHPVGFRLATGVADHQRHGGQGHVTHERDREQEARPIGSGRQEEGERERIQAGVVVGIQRPERLGTQEQEQEVHHGDDDVVADHEDVPKRPQHEENGKWEPDLLQLERQVMIRLPKQGEQERDRRQNG